MSRLTRYHQEGLLTDEDGYYEPNASNYYDIVIKLGQIEDILEDYGINDLTDLEIALDYYDHRFDGVHTERVDKDE